MKEGIVISDLHLFSRRSEGQARFNALKPQLKEVDTLVLNGDMFDFRWALRPLRETIPEAIEWLENLCRQFPHLKIHYVSGNHDCIHEFVSRLTTLDGIEYHHHHAILGVNLFVHGDAANKRMDMDGFNRFRRSWEEDTPRGTFLARLYDVSDVLHISDLTHKLWFHGDVAIRRIAWHLDQVVPNWSDTIDHCFFGHTHIPFAPVTRDGVTFANTGSGIRGMGFSPQRFTYEHETRGNQ